VEAREKSWGENIRYNPSILDVTVLRRTSLGSASKQEPAIVIITPFDNAHDVELLPLFFALDLHRVGRNRGRVETLRDRYWVTDVAKIFDIPGVNLSDRWSHLFLGNLTRTAPQAQRTAAAVGVSRLAHSTPQLYEGLVDITGTCCALNHSLGALPQEVEGSFTFRGSVDCQKPADQATDVSI
jgi:hypothetical protein